MVFRYVLVILISVSCLGRSFGNEFSLAINSPIKPGAIVSLSQDPALISLPIDIYILNADLGNKDKLKQIRLEFVSAQKKLKKCGTQIKINKVFPYQSNENFQKFESIEFNRGEVSPWEKAFYSSVKSLVPNILYVDSLDWTIGEDGTIAVAYPEFYLDLADDISEEDRVFYQKKMLRNTVLGNSRGQWTLTHELGHSLFNLKHSDDNNNLMFPYGFARSKDPEFNDQQCQQALEAIKYIKTNDSKLVKEKK